MPDVVLDTNVLSEALAQYLDRDAADRGRGPFRPTASITRDLAQRLNRIMGAVERGGTDRVVASTVAFVEVARKWGDIVDGRFTPRDMLFAFLKQPPEWFVVASVDTDLLGDYLSVPSMVEIGGRQQPIEWVDAIHAATTYSRGSHALLATTDPRLEAALAGRLAR